MLNLLALRKIAADGHDVIISDMKMPRGSGKDIYNAVVEKSPHLARRIMFMTGDGASSDTARFLKEAGNEIVLKPFTRIGALAPRRRPPQPRLRTKLRSDGFSMLSSASTSHPWIVSGALD